MNLNRPKFSKRVYLGDGPLSVLSSCKHNLLHDTKFITSSNLATPIHHFFWSSFEYSIASVFEERFKGLYRQTPFYLNTDYIDIILGYQPSMNVHELIRKFPSLYRRLKAEGIDLNHLNDQKINKEVFDVWKGIAEFGSVESVNLKIVLQNNRASLLGHLHDWIMEEYEKNKNDTFREFIHSISLIFLGGDFRTFTPLQVFYLASKLISANYFLFSEEGFAKSFLNKQKVSDPQVLSAPELSAAFSELQLGRKIKVGGYQGYLYTEKISFGSLFFSEEQLIDTQMNFNILRSTHRSIENNKCSNICIVKIKNINRPEMTLEIKHENNKIQFSSRNNLSSLSSADKGNGEFYVLMAKNTGISSISYSPTNPLGNFHEGTGFSKEETKLLGNAHFLGIIAGLFYSD